MNWLLLLNALYFLFGATMYVGTMWVLKFFLYPTWESLDRGNVDMHFGIPTRQATKFFTVVVPPMFISGIILVWSEWGTVRLIPAVLCLAGIIVLTGGGPGHDHSHQHQDPRRRLRRRRRTAFPAAAVDAAQRHPLLRLHAHLAGHRLAAGGQGPAVGGFA